MADFDPPIGRKRLDFLPKPEGQKKHWRENLSAVAWHEGTLLAADDENSAVCRLIAAGDGYVHEATTRLFDLAPDLPGGAGGEMDIEGLSAEGGHLWIVGSHSLAREQPKKKDDLRKPLPRLADVRADPTRPFLGRLPLAAPAGTGPADLPRRGAHADAGGP